MAAVSLQHTEAEVRKPGLPFEALLAAEDLDRAHGPIPFAASSSYPVRDGNSVCALIDGEPAFRRICEVIEAAQHSVWVTVTFMWAAFRMPDNRGTALDVLERAAARGLDVKVIFWRPDRETEQWKANAFWGASEHFELLKKGERKIGVRWDRAAPGFCQHQKSWLIDAGETTETAFVGGINLNPHSMANPGHSGEAQNHDVYVELAGPSVVDVHHNFVQRWNEASERNVADGRWGLNSEQSLQFPTKVPAHKGDAVAQVQRTIHRADIPTSTLLQAVSLTISRLASDQIWSSTVRA